MSEGERDEVRTGRGLGRLCRALDFYPSEVGALEGSLQRRDGTCFIFFKAPLSSEGRRDSLRLTWQCPGQQWWGPGG